MNNERLRDKLTTSMSLPFREAQAGKVKEKKWLLTLNTGLKVSAIKTIENKDFSSHNITSKVGSATYITGNCNMCSYFGMELGPAAVVRSHRRLCRYGDTFEFDNIRE